VSGTVLAHVAGLPLEEVLSLAVPLTTSVAVGARAAWLRRARVRGRRPTSAG
jgi:hypothetical protein